MSKRISILGSTGSIGRQTLEVIEQLADRFEVVGLAAGYNDKLLLQQAERFRPQIISLKEEAAAEGVRDILIEEKGLELIVGSGEEGLREVATFPATDLVVVATTGLASLKPLLSAIEGGKDIALANKEVLVSAGHIVMQKVREEGVNLIPVDSEHSAIFQCLRGQDKSSLSKIILTASGGPFRKLEFEELGRVTAKDALAHPTWKMGKKVTIDSATLMNKGLEVLEAHWLFGVDMDDIEIVIHPQSIVHSFVEFTDRSVLAQLSWPDMRLPIQYALTYPERVESPRRRLELIEVANLSFEKAAGNKFPCLRLAYQAGKTGGTMPVAMSAADEIAVDMFLKNKISFTDIPRIIEGVMEKHEVRHLPSLEEILEADAEARASAINIIKGNFCRQ